MRLYKGLLADELCTGAGTVATELDKRTEICLAWALHWSGNPLVSILPLLGCQPNAKLINRLSSCVLKECDH